ncbi:coenzyme F420-0:L-glutamate ligase [Eubacteriales bacterium OttesenSCG-928-M02]|nr:coenzyme F420-0:L-glutamate ligase [Eubacteriales bacterium OttesenSCG-928-M02]
MQTEAHKGKQIDREVNGEVFLRYPVKTHFIKVGEDLNQVLTHYVGEEYREGDIISLSEKIVSVCQENIVRKSDMKISRLAKFLSRFASKDPSGIGVSNVYKMQMAINLCGRLKVIWAAFASGVTKLFGKRGVFYTIVGEEIAGLDGFYSDAFPEYGEFGILLPKEPDKTCNKLYEDLGMLAIIVDINDFDAKILGKGDAVPYDMPTLREIMLDNPSGQGSELTPIVLIRKETATAEDGTNAEASTQVLEGDTVPVTSA